MSLADLAREWTPERVRELAEDLRADRVGRDRVRRLRELVGGATDDEQAAAVETNPAIADLLAALDLPPPPGFGPEFDDEPVPVDVDVGPDVEEPGEPSDGLVGVPPPDEEPTERGDTAGRRSISLSQTALAQRFPQPTAREQFQRMEAARRNHEDRLDRDVLPGPFYDRFADEIIGKRQILSRQEFVDARESPDTTRFF